MRIGQPIFRPKALAAIALVFAAACVAEAQQASSDASYPAPGHTFEAKFGERVFKLVFDPAKSELTFTRADGSSDTVAYTAKELRPGVYMVYWQEANGGSRVTQIEDFEKGVAYANIAAKDGKFYNLTGTWKRLD